MEQEPKTPTVIPFSRRHRWRWWAMIVMGSVFTAYGLALLTSPAWAPRSLFGVQGFWLWLRGEAYLIFGFLQVVVGVGYVRLTSRPAEAIIADQDGITVRRLYGHQHLAWDEVTHVRRGRSSILVAATPISIWKLLVCDPRLLRLDSTMVDASLEALTALVSRHQSRDGSLQNAQ